MDEDAVELGCAGAEAAFHVRGDIVGGGEGQIVPVCITAVSEDGNLTSGVPPICVRRRSCTLDTIGNSGSMLSTAART